MTEGPSKVREVHVAVAVIVREGRVLIARRPDHVHQGGLLEFPGGKVEPDETVQQALVREIAEETGLNVPENSLEPVIGIRHDYGDKRVFLDVWSTRGAEGEAQGCEGQAVDWLSPDDLQDEHFPAANRPIIRALRLPAVLPITGTMANTAEGVSTLKSALTSAPAPLVVLRVPGMIEAEYCQLAQQALAACSDAGAGLIVHGSPEVFRKTPGSAGLHLPWRQAAALSARPIPGDVWLGVSCHSSGQIAHAAALGADYVTLGPVNPTSTHPGVKGLGWEEFRRQAAAARVPVYGLGGLGPVDATRAREEGGQGIAGIRFWWPET